MLTRDKPGLAFEVGDPPTPPQSILVFGAAGQVGQPLVRRVMSKEHPPTLRLVASNADSARKLHQLFPGSDIVVANYFDLPAMMSAFEGMEAAFVIGADFMDEQHAMTNVAAASYHSGTIKHILRMTGAAPGDNRVADLHPAARDVLNPAQQFQEAREVLLACGTPVSFVNCWAAMHTLLTRFNLPDIVLRHTLSMPYDRASTFLDPDDVGEAAAELLLAGHDRRHDGTWHHLTGCERLRYADLADILSEELGMPIAYEDDPARFVESLEPFMAAWGVGPEGLLGFLQAEYRQAPRFMVSDTLPMLIGRPAKPIREFIREHREELLGNAGFGAQIREMAASGQALAVAG